MLEDWYIQRTEFESNGDVRAIWTIMPSPHSPYITYEKKINNDLLFRITLNIDTNKAIIEKVKIGMASYSFGILDFSGNTPSTFTPATRYVTITTIFEGIFTEENHKIILDSILV